jgi:hypothetical protein
MIVRQRGDLPSSIPIPLLPSLTFEDVNFQTLWAAVSLAVRHLRLTVPCEVEFGLLGTKGLHVGVHSNEFWGPMKGD